MADNMTPYVKNSLTLGVTSNPDGDADHLVLSQKGGKKISSNVIPDAPKDGKTYARKDGAWVEITV